MKYSHYLWDFNGTLFNDIDCSIQTVNTLLSRRSLPLIESRAHYRAVFNFPIIEYYRKIGFNFEKETYDAIAHEWIAEYLENSKSVPLYDGILDLLAAVRKSGSRQLVLSATEKNMLHHQLESLGILSYFDQILGLDNIHANSKVAIAKDWITAEKPYRAVLIGDTIHDFQVANEVGIDCLLVADGHQSTRVLEKTGVRVFANARELLVSGIL